MSFIYNIGHSNKTLPKADGYLVAASSFNFADCNRRDFGCPKDKLLLFDPQLYLHDLDCTECSKVCGKLSTYPWFPVEVPDFDSGVYQGRAGKTQWMNEVKSAAPGSWHDALPEDLDKIRVLVRLCLDFQNKFGVSHIIAPTPCVDNADDQFEVQLRWLRCASEIAEEYEQPVLGTIAIMDHLVHHTHPTENQLLMTILDQLTSNQGLDGAYVLVVSEADSLNRQTHENILSTLLEISQVVGDQFGLDVFVNSVDDFGYPCVGVGATGFITGKHTKQRRMCLRDYRDSGGGKRLPHFYSHSLIRDLLTRRDLSQFRDKKLLHTLENDVTPASKNLLAALQKKTKELGLPTEWEEQQNRDAKAAEHRAILLYQKTKLLLAMEPDQRAGQLQQWLRNAESQAALINAEIGDKNLKDDSRHIKIWRTVLDEFLERDEFQSFSE